MRDLRAVANLTRELYRRVDLLLEGQTARDDVRAWARSIASYDNPPFDGNAAASELHVSLYTTSSSTARSSCAKAICGSSSPCPLRYRDRFARAVRDPASPARRLATPIRYRGSVGSKKRGSPRSRPTGCSPSGPAFTIRSARGIATTPGPVDDAIIDDVFAELGFARDDVALNLQT